MLGTLNFIEPAQRIAAAGLVREGRVISLAQSFDTNGPQKGWRRRTNPVHTMTDTGIDAERGNQGFPHGIGGADDVISMPLQCSTQWDGLGHIFDHGNAWNGRRAGDVVTSEGDLVTGIEHAASVIVSRGVLLDVGRHLQPDTGELRRRVRDHRGRTWTPRAAAQGVAVGRGDIVLVRTGQLARARRDGWGDYAGGPAPGLSLTTAGWLHRTEIAAIATDTWGFEVRPNEFDVARVPAAAPGRDPEPRPHDRRDVGPGGAWARPAPSPAATSSCFLPLRFRSPARSAHPSTPSRSCRSDSRTRTRRF